MNETTPGGEKMPLRPVKKDDPLYWGKERAVRTAWFRENGPALDLDVPKLILGTAVGSIVWDDPNSYLMIHAPLTERTIIEKSKALALERLRWEISLPEVPLSIKEKLVELQQTAVTTDWVNADAYSTVRSRQEALVDYVKQLLNTDTQLAEAVDYASDPETRAKWQEPYANFCKQ